MVAMHAADGPSSASADAGAPPRPTEGASWRERGDTGGVDAGRWWAAVPGLVPLVVFAQAFLGSWMLAPGDGFTYYVPLRTVVHRAWRSGSLPGWDPWAFGGSPLLALHQAGVFYPPNLVGVLFPVQTAHNLAVTAAFSIAGTGTYLLARRLGADPIGAATAGVAFGLSGFMFGHVVHTAIIATTAWMPWVLWGFELLRERTTPGRLAAAAGTVAMPALAGHGQMLALMLAMLGIYAATLALLDRTARRHLLAVAAMVITGAGLAAVQLVPTAAVVGETARVALPYEEAMSYSFEPSSLLSLVFPFVNGNHRPAGPFTAWYQGEWSPTELSGYLGAAALVLAAAGLGPTAFRRDRRLVALLVVAGGCLLLALGGSTPFGRVVHATPLFGQLRSWGRASSGLDLVVACLAGLGVTALRRLDRLGRRAAVRRAVVAAAAVVGLALAAALFPAVAPDRVAGPTAAWALLVPAAAAVLAAGVSALVSSRDRLRAVPAALLVLVVAVDMLGFGWFFRWRVTSPTKSETAAMLSPEKPAKWGSVPDQPGGIDRMAYFGDPLQTSPIYQRVPGAKRIRTVNGFDPLIPRHYSEAVGDMDYRGGIIEPDPVWSPDSHVLDLLRVSVVVVHQSSSPPPPPHLGRHRGITSGALASYERRPRLDDAFLVGEAVEVSPQEALRGLWGEVPLDPAATALVEGECDGCRAADRPGRAGTVSDRRWGTDWARFEVDADRPAVLVVSQAWFPGWSAEVDGEPAPVVRVDGLVQGVPVEAGRHVVTMRYEPPGLRLGAAVSAATALGLVAWASLRRYRQLSSQSR